MIKMRNHNARLFLGVLLAAAMFSYVHFQMGATAGAEAASRAPAETAVLRG